MIPPFIQQLIGAFVRAAVVWAAGYLAAHGLTISENQTTQFIAWVTPVIATLAWSIYQKYRGRQKLMTALVTPATQTEHQVEAAVSAGAAPSVLTPKNQVPV